MLNRAAIDAAIAKYPQSAESSFGLSITRYSDAGIGKFVTVEAWSGSHLDPPLAQLPCAPKN
jgi:hypothetical protein